MKKFESIGFDGEARVVNCFAQDSTGMIWIGTNHGLYSYDGYSTYPHNTADAYTRSHINSMTIVGDTIFIGADCGLLAYDISRDAYCERIDSSPGNIRALAKQENNLLIGTLNGFFIMSLSSHEISEHSNGLSNNTVYSILNIDGEGLYVGTYNGLNKYMQHNNEFRKIEMPGNYEKKNTFVNSMLFDPERGCVWVGTEGSLYTMDLVTHHFTRIDGFGNNSIKSLALDDRNGDVIVGTDNGLYIYSQGKIVRYSHNSRISFTLLNNIVWSVFVDKDHNLWAGTDYNISMSSESGNNTISIAELTGMEDGNVIYAIGRDTRGLLWMGGANGIIRYNGNAEQSVWYTMDNPQHPLQHNRIREIYCDRENELWIVGDGGVNRYDYTTGQFCRYNILSSDRRYNTNWAYSIFEDAKGNLWVGSFLGGVFVINRKKLLESNGEAQADRHISFGDSQNFVNKMIPASDGGAWVLLYNDGGLYHIDETGRKYQKIEVEKDMGYQPSSIITTDNGLLWCANEDVVCVYNAATQKCMKKLKVSKYTTNIVYTMEQVADRVWLATNTGVWTINTNSFITERLNVPNHPYYSISYDKDKGTIALGGVDEIVMLNLSDISGKSVESDIYITAVMVNDKLYSTEENSVRALKRINLGHDENHIIINVSDFNYSTDRKTQFAYCIEELGGKWVTLPINGNRISCSNLVPGT
ncbi:MAG: two-component regulator propeller domain-containing protein, partial [Muribaculaceae bacterium]